MPRPRPTLVMHFTHVSHLESIVRNGLVADSQAHGDGLLLVEVGNVGVKDKRQRQPVPIEPGGTVADYAPFYFAPRSPTMFAIEKGNVSTYTGGCDSLVYLVTSVDALVVSGRRTLFTDRNAALNVARFTDDVHELDDLVDWPLMTARYWANTADDPDRRERRMAECLVYGRVPWEAFNAVVCRNQACVDAVGRTLASLGQQVPISVRPGWYF